MKKVISKLIQKYILKTKESKAKALCQKPQYHFIPKGGYSLLQSFSLCVYTPIQPYYAYIYNKTCNYVFIHMYTSIFIKN